ncbi:MAG: Chaperone protein DnaJ [candidate division WWE3 bacterium GW2011_GWA1_41_8]|uniref:Chaperone protein DnaJ n=3 Tax=Katanobacteria TaxID=422282 RepID=A0A0G1ABC3_UNCKA|nr:MAG: Chaperone protein DnaJ [candidate division WWE3 bacterium GW2011_GWB1_41_6]KKS22578.1 MAG: Chaperone protein DnaJ [candidate division WWE3 bacterium GW2011_GWA1_41_8]OGC58327.1 MAG: hypothetical protein A2976_03160 [candidate division WWE3 bacterium RIFCSPLOWO2_01_FULL_41_9]
MANGKDYYEVLGVPKNAGDEDIKKAYRNLAREHHPDVVKDGDKTGAEKRFKEINEAYQVLSDPQKRKMYDQYGHAGGGFAGAQGNGPFRGQQGGSWGPFSYTYSSGGPFGNAGAQGAGSDFDPFDVFEEFFGFRGFGSNRAPRKGKNLYYEMNVEFADAVHGAEKKINVESGEITIKIPAGVHDGTEMRFAQKGMPGPTGTPNGDLYLTLRVPMPSQFKRIGENLGVLYEMDFSRLILGDTIEVPVVDTSVKGGIGTAKLKIPAGTQSGTQFRIRGKGMPRMRAGGQGDVIVQVEVQIPKKVSKKQKELLEEYQKSL